MGGLPRGARVGADLALEGNGCWKAYSMGEFSLIRVLPQADPPQERSVLEPRPRSAGSLPVRPPALPNPGVESPSVLRIESGGATVWLVDHQLRLLAGPRPEHSAGVTL